MIGIRSAISIRARGQWPLLEAVYMTAPRSVCRNTKKVLAERGPSIHDGSMTPRTATLIGLTAILMWSLLAALTVATGKIPAFQLAAMTFAIGALAGFLSWIGRPDAIRALVQSPIAWIVGVGGLFGYHALYFLALRFAPPAEASLLNYLWPLLIVLFSSLLPGERLAP